MPTTKKKALPTLEDLTKRVSQLERSLKMLQAQSEIELDLTPEQEAELERRILEAEKNPGRGVPAADVMRKLREKYP